MRRKGFVGLILALQVADLLTTWWGLHHGAHEANPVLTSLFPLFGATGTVFLVKVLLCLLVLTRFRRPSLLYVTATFYVFLVAWNGWMIHLA